jgi:Core-2/I-Branching enzyme
MKIAFCFLTRANLLQPRIWERFFANSSGIANIYCHPKFPVEVSDALLKPSVITQLTATSHGNVSIVAATLNLFGAAYGADTKNEYFVLLSESTIPIVSLSHVAGDLERCDNRSLLGYRMTMPGTEHYKRLAKVRFKERFASQFFYHDQWVVLHRHHVQLLLDRPALNYFKDVFAADEHYFMNTLVHVKGVPIAEIDNRRTTFANWRERELRWNTNPKTGKPVDKTWHPKTYDQLVATDLTKARAENHWFFRKVSAACDCTAAFGLITNVD